MKNLWIAVGIIIISTFPYLHDVIQLKEGEFLTFSSRRVFLYMVLSNVFAHLGWLAAFLLAKGKPYRFAILIPVALSLYQVVILLTGLKGSGLNEATTKFYIIIGLSILLIIKYFIGKNKIK